MNFFSCLLGAQQNHFVSRPPSYLSGCYWGYSWKKTGKATVESGRFEKSFPYWCFTEKKCVNFFGFYIKIRRKEVFVPINVCVCALIFYCSFNSCSFICMMEFFFFCPQNSFFSFQLMIYMFVCVCMLFSWSFPYSQLQCCHQKNGPLLHTKPGWQHKTLYNYGCPSGSCGRRWCWCQ